MKPADPDCLCGSLQKLPSLLSDRQPIRNWLKEALANEVAGHLPVTVDVPHALLPAQFRRPRRRRFTVVCRKIDSLGQPREKLSIGGSA